MMTVWKFPFVHDEMNRVPLGQQTIEMPKNSTPVRVGLDGEGIPCVWVIVNTDKPSEYRRFTIMGTGIEMRPISDTIFRYVGAIEQELPQGWFLWHVFDAA